MTEDNTPKKVKIENYDYTEFDNLPRCKEKPIICPECIKRDGVYRLGHKHAWLNPAKQTDEEIEMFFVITHGHFALEKGTRTPALENGRNLSCEIEATRQMIEKKGNCETTIKLYRSKKMPPWLRKKLDGD